MRNLREQAIALLLEITLKWSRLLAAAGRSGEAVKRLQTALREDPANAELVRRLYALTVQAGDLPAASLLIRQYANELKRNDYSAEEIEQLLADARSGESH